jgi:hypothetical protein
MKCITWLKVVKVKMSVFFITAPRHEGVLDLGNRWWSASRPGRFITENHSMKAYWGVFLTLEIDGGGQLHAPAAL